MSFVKHQPELPAAATLHEGAGLKWLGAAPGGCPVVDVIEQGPHRLVMEFIDSVAPSDGAARTFGANLARTHNAGAVSFGCWPPGIQRGFIAGLELPSGEWSTFGRYYANGRLLPLVAIARMNGALTLNQADRIERLCEVLATDEPSLCGPDAAPSRIHGDLWNGNVLWRRNDAVLIDPSAQGGHRETDLAMLALFGIAYLDDIIDAYQGVTELAVGWQERISLHQVSPLLVHAVLFGDPYGGAAVEAASRYV